METTKRQVRTPLKRVQDSSIKQSPLTKFLSKGATPAKRLECIDEKENTPVTKRAGGNPAVREDKENQAIVSELKRALESLQRNLAEKESAEGRLRESLADLQRTNEQLRHNISVLAVEKEEVEAKTAQPQEQQWAGFDPETWTEALDDACKKNDELEEQNAALRRRLEEQELGAREVKRLRTERDAARKEASDCLYFFLVQKIQNA